MKQKLLSNIIVYALIIVGVLAVACAKQVALTGGQKDVTPPAMKDSKPENGSRNFNGKKIEISFNEYIKLNDVSSKLIVSPPLDEPLSPVVSGKKVKISIKPDLLKPNTTYCLNFNDAIVDLNEGNAMNSFVYAFSTGDEIDSLEVSGTVIDAFTKKTVDNVWVVLHSNLSDTAIVTTMPDYITKVDKSGRFSIPFIRDGQYKIYALRDNNSNFKFDLPEEEIAFIDTIFTPTAIEKIDSVKKNDSVILKTSYEKLPNDIELMLFKENKSPQYIQSFKRVRKNYFEVVFNSKQTERYKFTVFNDPTAIISSKAVADTVFIWLRDTAAMATDTSRIYAEYVDPAFPDSIRYDTLKIRRQDNLKVDTCIKLACPQIKEPHKDYVFISSTPIESFDMEKVHFFDVTDTIPVAIDAKIIRDTSNMLACRIVGDFGEKMDYLVVMDSAFISDIYGNVTDIDSVSFSVGKESDYGSLKINFNDDNPYHVQLLQGDKVVCESSVKDRVVEFTYIKPTKYSLRAIKDDNHNGRWDTGELQNHLQPENVIYYPNDYEIRSSWEHEITWEMK